ncbi:MAG: pyridoxal-phosphate dependent enzyme, partial [Gemmatimonadaceae bacterium]
MTLPSQIPLDAIRDAQVRLRGLALRTPLVKLRTPPGGDEIWLKLESLQPIGSFKIRGAGNAMRLADPARLRDGVWTASAGNMAQGVAWCAQEMGVSCTVVVPDHAPATKTSAVERMGGRIERRPFDAWWRLLVEHGSPDFRGLFVHPVADPAVIAGNGTIALEILDELPDVDVIVVPFGGGGLSCGIASATRQLAPHVRVVAAEVDTAAPLTPSLRDRATRQVEYTPSFVDGIGSSGVLPAMWPLVSNLVDGTMVVSVNEAADAVRTLVERCRLVAEGAGAAAVAATLALASGRALSWESETAAGRRSARPDGRPRRLVTVVS